MDEGEIEKSIYLSRRAKDTQDSIVSFKAASTTPTGSYIWTYRHTGCDVISVITTTVPLQNGTMKDIKLQHKETKRIRASNKLSKFEDSPLEEGLVVDAMIVRRKVSQKLRAEKKAFMLRLQMSRSIRSGVEFKAATKIQSVFRGHHTRNFFKQTRRSCEMRIKVRAEMRELIRERSDILCSLGDFRVTYAERRNYCATVIQCAFRCWLSAKSLRRKRVDVATFRKHISAVRIQCMSRAAASKQRVKKIRLQKKAALENASASTIQMSIRKYLAERYVQRRRFRLRLVAARMIQCWFRMKRAVVIVRLVRQETVNWNRFRGARAMQCVVRRFVARRRGRRIRMRRDFLHVHHNSSKMQAVIRGFLARIRVKRLRVERKRAREAADAAGAKAAVAAQESEARAQAVALLESVDIFLQARQSKVSDVDDIFHGRVSEEVSRPTETDGCGDTVLTIAASVGSVDLVRKCLLWGFDVNHRNDLRQTALLAAVKNNHTNIVQFLLLSADRNADSRVLISPDDAGRLLVAAATAAASTSISSPGSADILMTLLSKDLDVNSKDPDSGMTALHAACACGSREVVLTLLKHKADIDAVDDIGQTPLHKACSSAFEVVNLLLESKESIIAERSVEVGEEDVPRGSENRALQQFLQADFNGKDCWLLAVLGGQGQTVKYIEALLAENSAQRAQSEELGWTPNDITMAQTLAVSGNVLCLELLFGAGFDPSWTEEATAATLAMNAARMGKINVLDMLMERGVDLSVLDLEGKSVMHYAACAAGVIPFLLTHGNKTTCKINADLLKSQDKFGFTPVHIAALEGVDLAVDLLAGSALEAALLIRSFANNGDCGGMTPLHLACGLARSALVRRFTRAIAEAGLDGDGRSCVWHLFHPIGTRGGGGGGGGGRPICQEMSLDDSASGSRAERAVRLSSDIDMVLDVLKHGCPLYSPVTNEFDGEPFFGLVNAQYCSLVVKGRGKGNNFEPSVQSGDIIIFERMCTLLRVLPPALAPADCWRLVLSAVRFDDDNNVCLSALIEGGIITRLAEAEPTSLAEAGSNQAIVAPSIDTASILERSKFCGYTLIAWAIRLGRRSAVEFLLRFGVNPAAAADGEGNNCLHLTAKFASGPSATALVLSLIADRRIKLEAENFEGLTAAACGAKFGGDSIATRTLLRNKAEAQRCLRGKYWAWVLATWRRQERWQVNSQTGRFGDDDTMYVPTSLSFLPQYCVFYPKQPERKVWFNLKVGFGIKEKYKWWKRKPQKPKK